VTAPVLRTREGAVLPLAVGRFVDPHAAEATVLDCADGPVLDVGCGPGRHVLALARRGVMALGVDVTPAAVHLARQRGAMVIERSVFDRVPGAGRWRSALLLDGNVGIGGDAVALLRRVRALLHPRGRALVEVDGPGHPTLTTQVRVESGPDVGPWFPWALVGVDGVAALAERAGLAESARWREGGRWFVRLDRAAASTATNASP